MIVNINSDGPDIAPPTPATSVIQHTATPATPVVQQIAKPVLPQTANTAAPSHHKLQTMERGHRESEGYQLDTEIKVYKKIHQS